VLHFAHDGTTWRFKARIVPPTTASINFGSSVAISNGCGFAGAPGDANDGYFWILSQ
jgi:hypothetical protein